MSVFVLVCIDSFGKTKIGGIGMIAGESSINLKYIFEILKEKNKYFSKNIISIMTDKDIHFRSVIKHVFLFANLLLCNFHTSQTFERVLTENFMKVSSEEILNGKKLYYKIKSLKNIRVHGTF